MLLPGGAAFAGTLELRTVLAILPGPVEFRPLTKRAVARGAVFART
jgi:hypothetical protein